MQVGFIEISEDTAAAQCVALTCFTERERSRRPIKQGGSRMLLEEGDCTANRYWRAATPAPRSGKTALVASMRSIAKFPHAAARIPLACCRDPANVAANPCVVVALSARKNSMQKLTKVRRRAESNSR